MSVRRALLIALLGSLAQPGSAATTYSISLTGSDSNAGTSASPFRTLQKGVDMAAAGDTIIVQDGTYGAPANCIDPNNTWAVNINKAGTSLAPITLKAAHKWGAILDAQMLCHSYINFQANSAWWVIQDFDIQNGFAGGLWANSLGAKNITIKGNHIHHIGNRPDSNTLGIVGIYTDVGAQNFVIDGNVINNVGRTSDTGSPNPNSYDHGIYSHGNLTIINNIFYNSLAGWHIQTAIDFSGLIANNTFSGPNLYWGSSKNGQVMLWDVDGGVTIRDNLFYNSRGKAIETSAFSLKSGASCSVDNNIISGSGVTLGAPASCSASSNRLNTDPLFVNAAAFDFHLQSGSPAKDTGVAVPQATTDFDGHARPQGSAYDIGAFEYTASGSPCDVNNDNSTNVVDVQSEVNQALGVSSCTADINQDGSCNVIDVQRVANAALGGACVSP